MTTPHRKDGKTRKTQEGRVLRRYERRRLVERFWSWFLGGVTSSFAGTS